MKKKTIYKVREECDGAVFTRKQFFDLVENGSIIEYDGIGYFHDGNKETSRSVWDNNFSIDELMRYPYVCWYNR